jgi:competence protein ComEC
MKKILFILCMICFILIAGCVNPLDSVQPNKTITTPIPTTIPVTQPQITIAPTIAPIITIPVITQTSIPNMNPNITNNTIGNVTNKTVSNISIVSNKNFTNMTVTFIDVGQGDSEYIISPSNKTMLIDAGELNQVSKVTSKINVTTLDIVVATHPHADHIGGMKTILNTYIVGKFFDSGYKHSSTTYETMLTTIQQKKISYVTPKNGDTIDFDPMVTVKVLNPQPKFFEEINDNSIVLLMTYKNISFLFAGDTQLNAETMYAKGLKNVTVLKVAHHGSATSTGAYLISKTNPKVSIISVGKDNTYGHPDTYTIKRLVSDKSTVYRTDLNGSITVTTDGENYSIITGK